MNRKSLIGAALCAATGILLCAGVASAQTSPSLMVGIDVSPQLALGTRGTVALVKLDASNSSANVEIPSLTFSGTFAGGAGQTTFTNCSIAFTNAINIALNTGTHALSNFASTSVFTFDTPIVVPAGTTRWLGLVCDVDGATPQSGSVTVGVNPSTIGATNASSTAAIIPTASVGPTGSQLTTGTVSIIG
ncbi:MAG TPA: hypothetical protein VN701_01835, partial [Candidatus Paceibacterota bacterium]|nr:hypothetical protein [Candidatus Paceibacterota bacterium]